jgi:glycosyltransferase involved in cell wall biosynthesis
MPHSAGSGVVVYRARGGIDAIDEYSRRLVSAMTVCGAEVRYVPDGLPSVLAPGSHPLWVLLQYNPFREGRSGFAPGLLRDVRRVRRRSSPYLVVMVHEAWVDITDPKSRLIGSWQRMQLRALLRLADCVLASTEALARELGRGAIHVPIAANITPIPMSSSNARHQLGLDDRMAVALFGRANPGRALDYAEAAIAAIAAAYGTRRLAILNLGADAPALRVPPGVEVQSPGELSADDLSLRLWASDLVLLPFSDGVSTRRGTLMAALAHGRPVLGLRGRRTDTVLADAAGALVLTPVGDRSAFARAAVELATDRERLRAIGDAGRRLYESRFDWPLIARRVTSLVETSTANRSAPRRPTEGRTESPARSVDRRPESARATSSDGVRGVVFVAHEVGGSGGMERQSEQLIGRLLAAGRPVTVIARGCSLEHENLRFVRVPTPRRPASVGYLTFFAVASVLVARQTDALVHTTGAIVANRADVCTVHYCHRAAFSAMAGSRASRARLLYRVNAAVAGVLARAGESYSYRPSRTRVLCAVSGGVAAELSRTFPAMRRAIRVVANGVDATVFRPDPATRRQIRAELGVDEWEPLALFVGGDWRRKGLAYAVDALASAKAWHLAIAGAGDAEPLISRARSAGTHSRLHFLGTVGDMPRLYAAGDAFVFPTAYEAFPLVALEAAASGLPLLVTHVNGVEDLLEDGGNGWFVARDARDIARRLNELHLDPALAREMGEQARTAATGYSWEAMAATYASIYEERTREPEGH